MDSNEPDSVLRFEDLGSCIYCGATDNLHNEHIIPEALNGHYLLPTSSCTPCAKIINRFEGPLAKRVMPMMRLRIDAKSKRGRSKKDPTLEVQLVDQRTGKSFKRRILHTDHPMVMGFAKYSNTPELLDGPQPKNSMGIVAIPLLDRREYAARTERLFQRFPSCDLKYIIEINHAILSRLLCKIAHGYAVAQKGLGNFEPVLIDYMKTGEGDSASFLGGSYSEFPGAVPTMHRLHLEEVSTSIGCALVVHVQLFSPFNFPKYQVVAGFLT